MVIKRIHILYRVSYLKETIFAKEDNLQIRPIIKLICEASIDVLKHILDDESILKRVFDKA